LASAAEVTAVRSFLHSRKAVMCFPGSNSTSDQPESLISSFLLETTGVLAGILHSFRKQSVDLEWKNLPIIITLPLKKQLPIILKFLRKYLSLGKHVLYLEQARRLQPVDYKQCILIGTTFEVKNYLDTRIAKGSLAWFHLLAIVPGNIVSRSRQHLASIVDCADTHYTSPGTGTTYVFPVTIQKKDLASMAPIFDIKQVLKFPPTNIKAGKSLLSTDRNIYPSLAKREVLLPDIYRQMDNDIQTAANHLKTELEKSGATFSRSWFTVGAISGLLGRMRKEVSTYTPRHRGLAGHLLRLVHLSDKIKINPATELLETFSTLREPGAKGKGFLALPGISELESKLHGLAAEMHPKTAAVIKNCIDAVTEGKKIVVVSKSLTILGSLTDHFKNADIPVAFLAGHYHPSDDVPNGYSQPSKLVRKRVLKQFYDGSAIILFMPDKQLKYLEVAGVDNVFFHDYSTDGRGVKAVIDALRSENGNKNKQVKLFFVKGTSAEKNYWKIQQYSTKLANLPGNPNAQQFIVDGINNEIAKQHRVLKERERKKGIIPLVEEEADNVLEKRGLLKWTANNTPKKKPATSYGKQIANAIVPVQWNNDYGKFVKLVLISLLVTAFFCFSPTGITIKR
jgi:hypothetical protein